MADKQQNTICVKLPDDLALALRARADAEGLNISEILRSMIHQWVYNETPSVDDGYRAGRALGLRAAHVAVSHLVVPETYEEALAILQAQRR